MNRVGFWSLSYSSRFPSGQRLKTVSPTCHLALQPLPWPQPHPMWKDMEEPNPIVAPKGNVGLLNALKANQSSQAATPSWVSSPRSWDRGVSVSGISYMTQDTLPGGEGQWARPARQGSQCGRGRRAGSCRQPALSPTRTSGRGGGHTSGSNYTADKKVGYPLSELLHPFTDGWAWACSSFRWRWMKLL